MTTTKRLAVLISGRGTNLEALISNARTYKVVEVLSDNPEAGGLELAKQAGISALSFSRADFSSRREQKLAMLKHLQSRNVDLVALAGFMLIVDADFVSYFSGRLVNIHPSLLPEFPGLNTHARAIEAGAKLHGCSVHFVDSGVDTGPLIAQASCRVLQGDTPDTLAARVLQLEHKLYPWAVNQIAADKIRLAGRQILIDESALQDGLTLGFSFPVVC